MNQKVTRRTTDFWEFLRNNWKCISFTVTKVSWSFSVIFCSFLKFPTWIILFPVFTINLELLGKSNLLKKLFIRGLKVGEIIPLNFLKHTFLGHPVV